MVVTAAGARRHETPNAVMRTLAAPSVGAAELSVWEVVMRPGQQGPVHTVDREQVWAVLAGSLQAEVDGEPVGAGTGDTLRIAAGVARRISAVQPLRAIVASPAAPRVRTPDGGERALPWAA